MSAMDEEWEAFLEDKEKEHRRSMEFAKEFHQGIKESEELMKRIREDEYDLHRSE
jgi:hypothetical protein